MPCFDSRDFTDKDVPNPKLAALSVDGAGREARYLRVTVTKLAPRQEDYIFALAELEVLTLNGKNVARGKPVTALAIPSAVAPTSAPRCRWNT